MIEIVPVSVRCSEDGKYWFARGLTFSALGRGRTPGEALVRLKESLAAALPAATLELRIRSVSVTFPTSLSEEAFLELDLVNDKGVKVG